MTTTHKLKTVARYFDAIVAGTKTFEVRLNDRAFQTGDILELVKIDDNGRYMAPPTSKFGYITCHKRVSYLLQGGQFGIEPRWCVMGLADLSEDHPHE